MDGGVYYFDLGDTTLMWWTHSKPRPLPLPGHPGHFNYALQTVTVRDRQAPRGVCPADFEWYLDDYADSVRVYYDDRLKVFTDNCTEDDMIDYRLMRGMASGDWFKRGETLIRYEISDRYVLAYDTQREFLADGVTQNPNWKKPVYRVLKDKAGNDSIPTLNTTVCEFRVTVTRPYRPLQLELWTRTLEICPGVLVEITPEITGGTDNVTYRWNHRQSTEPVMRDYPESDRTYTLTASDGRTTEVKSVDVSVRPRPRIELELDGRDPEFIFEGEAIQITATPGFDVYTFFLNGERFTRPDNVITFEAQLGSFEVQVFGTDVNGCVAQDYIVFEIDSRKLPNVFTPNSDGKNEVFLEGYMRDGDRLEIVNRAGILMYDGISTGWDGYCRRTHVPVPQGEYLYILHRRMNNDEMRIYKGTVTLKR
jgi:gliding motility-associated-like protein